MDEFNSHHMGASSSRWYSHWRWCADDLLAGVELHYRCLPHACKQRDRRKYAGAIIRGCGLSSFCDGNVPYPRGGLGNESIRIPVCGVFAGADIVLLLREEDQADE